MKLRFNYIFIVVFIVISSPLFSQVDDEFLHPLDATIEDITATTGKEEDYSSLFDDINYFIENPIDINTADAESLRKLFFINEYQINNLLAYIYAYGQLLSIYELMFIDGFSNELIERILPYICISPQKNRPAITFDNLVKNGHNQLLIKSMRVIEKQKGYLPASDSVMKENPDSRYLGNSYKIYTRYKFSYANRISAGFTAEKDAGEELFKNTQKQGFDFYSAHLMLQNTGKIKTAVIGDYLVQFGQGLTLWTGFPAVLSAEGVMNIIRNPAGIKSHSSTDENLFMRGFASTICLSDIEITAFYSRKRIDASIISIDSGTGNLTNISSFQTSGYHTTISEVNDKDAVSEIVTGGNISLKKERIRLGMSGVYYCYGANVNKKTEPHNQFEFSGSENFQIGFDYLFKAGKITIFGEESLSKNLSAAVINGVVFSAIPQLSFCILHRNYQYNFPGLYSSAFGQNSRPTNENGIYMGIELYPDVSWKLSAWYDFFDFPWLRYNTDEPSTGESFSFQAGYYAMQKVSFYTRLRCYTGTRNLSDETANTNKSAGTKMMNWRINMNYYLAENLSLCNRIELCKYTYNETMCFGYLTYQDFRYSFTKLPVKLSFRFTVFDTRGYDSRIYSYEDDLLYEFSSPSYSSKGTRTYILFRYDINETATFWIKIARTSYPVESTTGSGLAEIQGRTKSDIKALIRFRF